MTLHAAKDILVIGIGNAFRKDDGAGIEVVRNLAERNMKGVEFREESGEGAALMEAWQGFGSVILVDAVSSGYPAGTLHVLDPMEQKIPSDFFHYSTHAFSVAEAVELARALGRLPERMRIYGIEGKDFGSGEGFSPKVERSILEAARCVESFIGTEFRPERLLEGVANA